MAGFFLKFIDKALREARIGEGLEGFGGQNAHHLPVSGHRVFAIARLRGAASQKRADDREWASRPGYRPNSPMPKLSITGTLIPPTDCGRVDPGIGPAVIEFGGIRLFADAGRIGDDQEDTLKWFHIFILCGTNPLTIIVYFRLLYKS
jgi:hypothetical protein